MKTKVATAVVGIVLLAGCTTGSKTNINHYSYATTTNNYHPQTQPEETTTTIVAHSCDKLKSIPEKDLLTAYNKYFYWRN